MVTSLGVGRSLGRNLDEAMYTLDDPTLALILRFVGRGRAITFRDEEFLREQAAEIRRCLEGCPAEERQDRALQWVEEHAREQRERWAKDAVGEMFSNQRCPDCPLAGTDLGGSCEIHQQWLELLRRYVGDEIDSRTYVEDSLALLASHKERLKPRLRPARVVARVFGELPEG